MAPDLQWEQRLRESAQALMDAAADDRIREALHAENVALAIREFRAHVQECHAILRQCAAEKTCGMSDREWEEFNRRADVGAPPHSEDDVTTALQPHLSDAMMADAIEQADFLDEENCVQIVRAILMLRFEAYQYLAGFGLE